MAKTERKLKRLLASGKIEEANALATQFPQLSFKGNFRQQFVSQHTSLKRIEPLTPAQVKTFEAFAAGKNLVLHGAAGTGKSFLGLYLALNELLKNPATALEKALIIRSVVPTRDMGFLPGPVAEKSALFEGPYQAICAELIDKPDAYGSLKSAGTLAFTTTSHLRGLTFNNTILIVDEINNMTFHELDTCITRVGKDCRVILSGDINQSDLTGRHECSGLARFLQIVSKMPSFEVVDFGVQDIVRSGLVREYLLAKMEVESEAESAPTLGIRLESAHRPRPTELSQSAPR